ncbi:site-specific integrase [Hydrogenophaga sp. 2FB]|uniref:tyrosine-type recombinase/integrase n=1 Tax=Hydrogenophaga sp. 2FB TaxID=2502187 RepID=UPI0010FA055F|nr:site-specific integrase [Hydrogenophaga sp. 2FB]
MAEKLDFTIRAIEALPTPSEGRNEYKDARVPGLYLRVTNRGVKTFSCVGRAKGSSKVERVTLGKFPAVKPEQARTRALEIAGQQAGGVSPASSARERRGEMTVNDLYTEYLKHAKLRVRAAENIEIVHRIYIAPQFGNRRLSEVTGRDVAKWHQGLPELILRRRQEAADEREALKEQAREEIAARQAKRRHGPLPKPKASENLSTVKVTGHVTANRAMDQLRAMYNWAAKPVRAYFTGTNPASGHTRFAQKSRERFLLPNELAPFFKALTEEPNEAARDAILTKLLTGVRRENVHSMQWAELDLNSAEWHIPKTKNGTPQTVPLGPEVVVLLKEREQMAKEGCAFVFPAERKSKTGHIGNLKSVWARVLKASGLRNIRQHDLRRTLGSWQARTGASMVIIGKTLNHKHPGSTAVYARLDTDPVRDSVGRAVAAMYEAAGLKTPAEIIQMSPNRAASR